MANESVTDSLRAWTEAAESLEVDTRPGTLATSIGATVMLVFFVEGLLGNLLILISISVNRRTWNTINIFIGSLCVNDLLSLCLVVALIIDSYVRRRWTAGDTMCRLNPELTVALVGSSLWHTALIAIHRYLVVVHNGVYKRMHTTAYVLVGLVMARLIPLACAVPGLGLHTSGYVVKLLRCILLPAEQGRIISVTVVQVVLPCLIVCLWYALIFAYVCRMARQVHSSSSLMLQKEVQITKMFGVIFLNILLGFVPYAVVRNADHDNDLSATVYVVVSVFYGVASCSSPLVYGAMSSDIRRACALSLAAVRARWTSPTLSLGAAEVLAPLAETNV